MRLPFARASWTMRLMGAYSGLTIATSRLADTMLPKPMLISFMALPLFPFFLSPLLCPKEQPRSRRQRDSPQRKVTLHLHPGGDKDGGRAIRPADNADTADGMRGGPCPPPDGPTIGPVDT